ncbi:hypothetical protein CMO88_01470 [Candidatus Woesearchaeota archaeon]|nr:hypothetical protein [Candidatus Woesearchaeota archaeon]|tara:strand:+ start:37540 stop:38388 length:849 start_codon:yes stop_codon:yes gene_type:complete
MTEITLGGQAVIEGVLMRTKTHYAIAVRDDKGKIIVKKEPINTSSEKFKILKLPFLRGVLALYDTLILGFKALIYSAHISAGEKERLSKKEMAIAIFLSVILAVTIFIALPFFFASLATKENLLFNLIDGVLRLVALFGYLIIISLFKDVRRLFEYHGAEHMTIHAYEHKKELSFKKIEKYKTMHPRCGTSFLLIVVVLSVIVFSVITADNFLVKFLSRLMLLPVIAGLSYEILKFSAKNIDSYFVKPLTFPGIWLQYITTKRPDKKQIEVAVAALKALVKN